MPLELFSNLISPPCRAVQVLAEHLGLELQMRHVDVSTNTEPLPALVALNPNHTIPVLRDGDLTLFESRAILTYLVNQYAPGSALYPTDPKRRAAVDKMLYFDAAGYYPALRAVFLPIIDRKELLLEVLREKLRVLEALLGEQKYFNGSEPSLADISIGVSVPIVKRLFPELWSDKLNAWYGRVELAIPAMQHYNSQLLQSVHDHES